MILRHLSIFATSLQFSLTRWGIPNIVACILLLSGSAGWLWLVPHFEQTTFSQEQALKRAQVSPQKIEINLPPTPSLDEQKLTAFYELLSEANYEEQQIKTIFAIAIKNGLSLKQATYKFTENKDGKYASYQIDLPVKGTYQAVRSFCEQILLAMPFASLDDVRLKRDAIVSKTVDAQLRFTLYLRESNVSTSLRALSREDNP